MKRMNGVKGMKMVKKGEEDWVDEVDEEDEEGMKGVRRMSKGEEDWVDEVDEEDERVKGVKNGEEGWKGEYVACDEFVLTKICRNVCPMNYTAQYQRFHRTDIIYNLNHIQRNRLMIARNSDKLFTIWK